MLKNKKGIIFGIANDHSIAWGIAKKLNENGAEINLEENEKGISPGQACVFYSKDNLGERVLGGGWIGKTINKNLSTQLTNH